MQTVVFCFVIMFSETDMRSMNTSTTTSLLHPNLIRLVSTGATTSSALTGTGGA
jgi:hypothetical protein